MGNIGLPELLFAVVGLLPFVIAAWAVFALVDMRRTQRQILARLASVEAALRDGGRADAWDANQTVAGPRP